MNVTILTEKPKKKFVAYYYCNGWDFNLGISICWHLPNIEIHIPTGFIRIGWSKDYGAHDPGEDYGYRILYRSFGWSRR